ncbi:MAG: 1-acyl-sn-glycerol-3-phosphate acyltransferase, partial [Verrucomicrobiota bacterium]
ADVAGVNAAVRERLNAGLLVTLFPEGTSSDGGSVLPFQPSLLQPVVDLAVPVAPAHIAYTGLDGLPAEDIAYFGDRTLGACLLALFKRREIQATVRLGEAVPPSNRKTLATQLHAAVSSLAR